LSLLPQSAAKTWQKQAEKEDNNLHQGVAGTIHFKLSLPPIQSHGDNKKEAYL